MMHSSVDIKSLMVPGKCVHLSGIGGVSMCPLAEVLAGMGMKVQGSDMNDSDTVRHLRSQGISVAIGHSAENLKDCDLVIRTAAIHDENPEIVAAISGSINCVMDTSLNAELLAAITAAVVHHSGGGVHAVKIKHSSNAWPLSGRQKLMDSRQFA